MADKPPPRKQPKRIRSEEQKLKKKGYDLARAKSRVNIGVGFQRWRNLRELKCMKTDEDLALFLLDCFDQNSLSPGIALRVQSIVAAVPGPTPVKSEELNHSSADEVVVKLECLLQLFKECLACCSECSISTERDGWFFYVTQKCQQCHYSRNWASHPTDQIISDPAENHEVSSSDSESVYTSDSDISTDQKVCLDQGATFNIFDIISKAANGRRMLSSLEENGFISHTERRSMVRILVSHLMERFGENPTSGTKALLASSIVEQFPCLRDCQGSGYDAWFTPGKNHKPATGFLEERLRNVRKQLHRGQRQNSAAATPQQDTPDTLPESAWRTESDVYTPEPEVSTEQNISLEHIATFNIREILNKAPNGKHLVASLEENGFISHPERRSMVRILVSNLMECFGENPTSGTKALLASSIMEQFPCLRDSQGSGYDAWFTPGRNHKPATGFLEERLRNVRKRLHRGQRQNSAAATPQQDTPDTLPESTITTERAIQLTEWLKNNTWPPSQVNEVMLQTAVHRAQWIRADKARPIQDIIAEFPRLVDTPDMISQDFSVLYPESSGRLKENWCIVYAEKIIRMARTERTNSLLTNIDLLPTDKRGDIALQLLPVLLRPSPYKVGKRVFRHSSVECQNAFINTQPIGMTMADYLTASAAEYPYVLMLGEEYDCSQVFVVINGIPLEHQSLLSAVDACFKAFFILQLQYPKPCAQVWEFIQTVVFGIPGHESNTVKLMRSQLSA
ncbi:hypothetical protein AALO_G00006040 [Alosa alosa]|uniref:Uncharacterized protein n=1 Tax=Alosa alosa TaxID=278164 RepID=A0AAV6HJM6_9TELE|nr:hypothetical protein AALO_G00006040 [Alosa alosa]